jgi:hypothetical protein
LPDNYLISLGGLTALSSIAEGSISSPARGYRLAPPSFVLLRLDEVFAIEHFVGGRQ